MKVILLVEYPGDIVHAAADSAVRVAG